MLGLGQHVWTGSTPTAANEKRLDSDESSVVAAIFVF
jgi:hypothetical protein